MDSKESPQNMYQWPEWLIFMNNLEPRAKIGDVVMKKELTEEGELILHQYKVLWAEYDVDCWFYGVARGTGQSSVIRQEGILKNLTTNKDYDT